MKICSSISAVVWEIRAATQGSNCTRQGISIPFTAMCSPFLLPKWRGKRNVISQSPWRIQGSTMIGEQEEFLQDCCTSPWSYSGGWNKGKKMVALLEGYSITKSQEQKRTFSMASKKTPKRLYSDNGPVTAYCKSILRMTAINKFLPWNTTRPPKQNKVFHWLDGQRLLTSRQPQHRATGNR